MCGKRVVAMSVKFIAMVVVLGVAWYAIAQDAQAAYPSMAPLDQYLMEDRSSEIALARSAAPESISRDAEVLVLGRHGYETAIKGTNGFVCLVERSWTAPIDDPGFWNPKGRAPICLNAAAARSYLPRTIKKTDLILAGRTKAQMVEAIAAAVDSALPTEVRKGEKGITLCMPMPFKKATQTDGVQEETAEEQTCYAFCFRAYWLCSHRARGRTVNQGRSRQFKSVESATLSKSPRELSCDPIWAEL